MKLVIVYNPKSGSALGKRELSAMCRKYSIEIEAFVELDSDFTKRLAPYVTAGAVIAAIGGDGTISAVASQLADTKATLIPLPGGTLNHFTKDLGVLQNLEKAFAGLEAAEKKQLDVATVNDTVFINNSSLGLYPSSLRERKKMERTLTKWPSAVWASVKALARFKLYELEIDGKKVTTPFVFVGNNRYLLHRIGSPDRDKLDAGVLSLFVAHTTSRLGLLKILLLTTFGVGTSAKQFDASYPKEVSITSDQKEFLVSHDGEMSRLKSPIVYKIRQKSLTVLISA